MDRYICIHGHFYQPPRENPWLESIELQDSAYPYHDWNERITAEAYGPNARSRILDGEERIVEITNNYAKMSFNFGPTLLAWMEAAAPDVYAAILEADRQSMERFSGHGSAQAQAYNHMIMPLANSRDKYTQVVWGLRDFEHRFRRKPEAMWLPETAVDLESLDIMAQLGLRFVILEPHQAKRVRRLGGRAWGDVSGGRIDPTRPYTVLLPSGRKMDVFFYDGPISRAVAFEGLLSSGEQFASRLNTGFSDARSWPQLVNIATDGESYGHHHRYGDMALAYALNYIESAGIARLTNYGEYLEMFPSQHEVEIYENTSWSCAHGVERWRSDCGCNSGGRPEWNQAWRGPLRAALDWLRDAVAPLYEQKAGQLLRDPWAARDGYIDVVLDRSDEGVSRFFSQHASRELTEGERVQALKLLELQRHAMLMYTSCGWFFDELSGIETTQVIQYAGRVIQLAQELFGDSLEEGFLERLAEAKSNIPEHQDGRVIYEKFVRPAMVDLAKVGAHYAVSSLFESYPQEARIYCYEVDAEDYRQLEAGVAKLAVGKAEVTSVITRERERISFGVLHFGDHNITAGVRRFEGDEPYSAMLNDVTGAFARADLPEVVRLLDKHFGDLTYSLKSLFRDEQRKILDMILESTLTEAESSYRQIFEHHAPLMRFLLDLGIPLPGPFRSAAELTLNSNLRRCLSEETIDAERVRGFIADAQSWNVGLDSVRLAYTFEQTLKRIADAFAEDPADLEALERLDTAVTVALDLPFAIDLAHTQNRYYDVLKGHLPRLRERAGNDAQLAYWVERFLALGPRLSVRVE